MILVESWECSRNRPEPTVDRGAVTNFLPLPCPIRETVSQGATLHLIQFARAVGCYLVEDDYDSEFRYSGTPVSSLQELEPERVIYVGTLSKVLSPALRLGYIALPPPLIERCRQLKRLTDLHSAVLEQLALAHFIEEGHLERHILKMKKIYRKRRERLIAALETHFSSQIQIYGDIAGLHLVAEFG
jgi:GntR family transcriptional regulator / MocR family aminotransferase